MTPPTPEYLAQLRLEYTNVEISKKLQVPEWQVHRWVKQFNLPRKRGPSSEASIPSKKVLLKLVAHYTLPEIARKYRVHRSTIWNWCQEYGIETPCAGGHHPSAQLTDDDVRMIRELYEEHGLTQKALAEKFDACPSVISRLVRYKTRINVR